MLVMNRFKDDLVISYIHTHSVDLSRTNKKEPTKFSLRVVLLRTSMKFVFLDLYVKYGLFYALIDNRFTFYVFHNIIDMHSSKFKDFCKIYCLNGKDLKRICTQVSVYR